ncbi:MAG: hypothetical protein Q8M19_19370 [Reyranella sp.]|nr:hypothetical protein [Reyranella sp.]
MADLSRCGFAASLAALPLLAAAPSALQARSAGPLAQLPVTVRCQIGRAAKRDAALAQLSVQRPNPSQLKCWCDRGCAGL